MPVYQRQTRIRAPLSAVWELYSRPAGVLAISPSYLDLRIEAIRGPDGEPRSRDDELTVGSVVQFSMQPFGVGPRERWTSRIVERTVGDEAASFRDEMLDGPFPRWSHTHRFYAEGPETVLVDRVEYRLPGGPLGTVAGTVGRIGLEPVFRHRHRRTRALLEE